MVFAGLECWVCAFFSSGCAGRFDDDRAIPAQDSPHPDPLPVGEGNRKNFVLCKNIREIKSKFSENELIRPPSLPGFALFLITLTPTLSLKGEGEGELKKQTNEVLKAGTPPLKTTRCSGIVLKLTQYAVRHSLPTILPNYPRYPRAGF